MAILCSSCNQPLLVVDEDKNNTHVAPCYSCNKESYEDGYGKGYEYAITMEVNHGNQC